MSFIEPNKEHFTIYSKSGCQNCMKLKAFLKEKCLLFTIIDCDEYILEDKEAFLTFIKEKTSVEHKTFPIVFYYGEFIGGFTETQKYVERMLLSFDDYL